MVRTLAHGIQALMQKLDRWQQRRQLIGFVFAVVRKYLDDEAGARAALLAYYGFLSLFPLLLILTTVFRIVLHNDPGLSGEIIHSAVSYFPALGQSLQENVHSLDKAGLTLVVGILLALFGARGVADVLQTSLDHIWQVPYSHRRHFPQSLLRSLGIVIVGGVCLAVAPVIFGYALNFAPSRVVSVISALLTAVVMFWLLVWVIKFGSSARQPLHRIWLGAFVAVVALSVLQAIGGFIVGHELQRLDTLYGTFALVLGIIFWLYLQTQLLLLALEVDPVRAFKLAPRSFQSPLTDGDRAAYQLYHSRGKFHDGL
ncbi:MAG TPA: YihY/virulence factor BrkB family protein [Verrucomicrobiae bacterium]|nr:YihY/virulence factor BrkB family protein [Verrucomicrobiae bacterium]